MSGDPAAFAEIVVRCFCCGPARTWKVSWFVTLRAGASVGADWALALVVVALRSSASATRLLRRLLLLTLVLIWTSTRTAGVRSRIALAHGLLSHHLRQQLGHHVHVVLVGLVGRLRVFPLSLHLWVRRVMMLEDLLGGGDLLWREDGSGFDAGVHCTCTLSLLP